MAEGVVRAGRFGGSAREGGGRALYLLTPYSWWLRAQVSRDAPPPLPGGYTLGDKVFFTGASHTFPNGDKVVHGQQGEVMGPANLEGYTGKGVEVRFPGNKFGVDCFLTQVHRLRAASAASPRLHPTSTHRAAPLPRLPSALARHAPPIASAAARAASQRSGRWVG